MQSSMAGKAQPAPLGALIFSCNGRGMGLYAEEAFDSRTLASYVPVPSAGFFCNGGPFLSHSCLALSTLPAHPVIAAAAFT